jgi:tetratricopeptide (TPR) repeat protein
LATLTAEDCHLTIALRPVARAFVTCLVSLCLSPADAGSAQTGRQLPQFIQTQAWIRLAKAHQMGRIDDPLRTLASWAPARIEQIDQDVKLIRDVLAEAAKGRARPLAMAGRELVLTDLASLLDLEAEDLFMPGRQLDPTAVADPAGQPRFEIAKVMVRVAMLHTDLMMVSRDERAGIRLAGLPSTTLRVDDAKGSNVSDPGVYWDVAREAMDLVVPTPRGRALATDWYRVTSEYLLGHRDYALAAPHLQHARDVLPGDAQLAFDCGVVYENLAASGIQAAVPDDQAALTIGSRPILLANAEFHFRSALLLEPGFHEAALRLGRILELLGRHEEALSHLRRVETLLPRPALQYYAALLVGRAHEAAGRSDEARAAFERALKHYPDAQSARLALAALTFRASGQIPALPYVRSLGAGRPGADPWWAYDVSSTAAVSDHVDALRLSAAEVLR